MTVTLNLSTDAEEALKVRAQALGLSVEEWRLRLAEREVEEPVPARKEWANLSELLFASPFAGANLHLERRQDYPRRVEIE